MVLTRHLTHRERALRADAGFSLVEMLMVLVILSILLSVGVGSYLRLRDKSEQTATASNVREALAAVELYFAHNDSYHGMTIAQLKSLDAGVSLDAEPVISADGEKYCIEATEPGHFTYSSTGPGGSIVPTTCPASL